MSEEKLLTVREVAQLLNLTEKEIIDLAEQGRIPAYKIGGVYLRFKRQQVDDFRKHAAAPASARPSATLGDKVIDFFYFNDFYIVSLAVILALLYIIFK
ncbi:MAG: helix-turn-helix domain-containing protein [Candidatus Omnitrophica bacterium]|nr:helix-turn-helix domain-containing protein [Candidatus Omnitrophota bacterium]